MSNNRNFVRRMRDVLEESLTHGASPPLASLSAAALQQAGNEASSIEPERHNVPPPAPINNDGKQVAPSVPVNLGSAVKVEAGNQENIQENKQETSAPEDGGPSTSQSGLVPTSGGRLRLGAVSIESLNAGPTRTPPPEPERTEVAGSVEGRAERGLAVPGLRPPQPMPKPKLRPIRAMATIAIELIRHASQTDVDPQKQKRESPTSVKLFDSSDKPKYLQSNSKEKESHTYQQTPSKESNSSKLGQQMGEKRSSSKSSDRGIELNFKSLPPLGVVASTASPASESTIPPLLSPPPSIGAQQLQSGSSNALRSSIAESLIVPVKMGPGTQAKGPQMKPKPLHSKVIDQAHLNEREQPQNESRNDLNLEAANAGQSEVEDASHASAGGGGGGSDVSPTFARSVSQTVQPELEQLPTGGNDSDTLRGVFVFNHLINCTH